MIQKLYKLEDEPLIKLPAVTKTLCNRCLSKNIFIENDIAYCLDCYEYGEVSELNNLYRYNRNIDNINHVLKMDYSLTKLQVKGSDFLLNNFESKKDCFLQAVCGAGKTEMTYKVILKALNDNLKVAFVIPRVEVLIELFNRFRISFPKTKIALLYQQNKNITNENLVLTTPQQLINFHQEFDLLILDEADSFPYAGNKFLERLVKKSINPKGNIFYMSATLTKDLDLNNLEIFLIPARYHLRPMTVPVFKRTSKSKIIKTLGKLLNKDNRCIIFVPSINLGEILSKHLNELGLNTNYISSKTVYKAHLIKSFINEEYNILISTTLLERGVTFKNINVYVIEANHKVFTKETLIQISGRVGRHINHPNGELIFYSEYQTKAMKEAKAEIVLMNERLKSCNV